MSQRLSGPGPIKARGLPLVRRRSVELLQGVDHHWRQLFESADVMSEGATRQDREGPTYYGMTSLLLPFASHGGTLPELDADRVGRALLADPHARLRAIRIACREAQLRSQAPLARVSAEVQVRPDRRGLRIDIEVEARVLDVHEGPSLRRADGAASSRVARAARR